MLLLLSLLLVVLFFCCCCCTSFCFDYLARVRSRSIISGRPKSWPWPRVFRDYHPAALVAFSASRSPFLQPSYWSSLGFFPSIRLTARRSSQKVQIHPLARVCYWKLKASTFNLSVIITFRLNGLNDPVLILFGTDHISGRWMNGRHGDSDVENHF